MPTNIALNRQSIRVHEHDYTKSGAYFITICTQNRACLFGYIMNGEMRLNDAGQMIQSVWGNIACKLSHAEMDQFIIMPNHIHGIIKLHSDEISCRGEPCVRPFARTHNIVGEHTHNIVGKHTHNIVGKHKVRPYGTKPNSIGRIIQAFKSITTHQYVLGVAQLGWTPFIQKCWQRNYWERIIRNDIELQAVRQYIKSNPAKWPNDN